MKTPSEWHGVTYSVPLKPRSSNISGFDTANRIAQAPPPDVKNHVDFKAVRDAAANKPKEKPAKNPAAEKLQSFSTRA